MCVTFLHYHPDSSHGSTDSDGAGVPHCTCPYLLIAANNRDECFDRASAPLSYWGEDSLILAGNTSVQYTIIDFGGLLLFKVYYKAKRLYRRSDVGQCSLYSMDDRFT